MTSNNSKEYRKSVDQQGKKRIPKEIRFGNYILGSTLGEGEFAKVKLGWRKDGKNPSQAAIKLIKRESIPQGSEKENKIHREITALKKLRHPNIVRLVEVLQNDKYIGIVLEYASGGELFEYILEHRYLKESMACKLFSQLVSGVDYMHAKGVVHRDLKLENLLLDKHKNIIITDFGFNNTFGHGGSDLMKTSCGSPCYAAPELVVSTGPYEGRKVDVWSCGVILYAMLSGYLPFDDDPQNPDGSNLARLYHYITHTPLTFPEYIQPTPRDLLRKILVSNPDKRISLRQVRNHQWLAPHTPFLSVTPLEWDRNYRSSKIIGQDDRVNRRMSLMENPTSASLMLTKPNVRSYSNHNVSASLYSNPAAPQTSRTVAVPSAEGSPVASPVRITKHSRTGSSASIALQAVVDQDVEIKRRYSGSASDLTTTPVRNQRPLTFMPLFTDSRNIETITESPETNRIISSQPPVFAKPDFQSVKLSPRNKPRPTSYHPGSTASNYFTETEYTSIRPQNLSESSLPYGKNFKRDYSSTSESIVSISEGPTLLDKFNANKVDTLTESLDALKLSQIDKSSSESRISQESNILKENANELANPIAIHAKPEIYHEKEQEKYKRYSFLGFYSSTFESVPKPNEVKAKPRPQSMALPKTSSSGSRVSSGRKPLEPANATRRRVSQKGKADEGKEEMSTTKKLMDFFKRRSIRI
ncbi:protein kinase [Martiniozyma asiatica (nom. inval.)]|nr:protein kinase [Martiniozyma asiatica]